MTKVITWWSLVTSTPTPDHASTTWGGPTHVMNNCVAATLTALGSNDTFRGRHAEKVAFTYISKSVGSRLDQILTRPAAATCLEIMKATIILK